MLDVSQYTGSRKRRGLDIIEFWRPDHSEKLRRTTLIYNTRIVSRTNQPTNTTSKVEQPTNTTSKVEQSASTTSKADRSTNTTSKVDRSTNTTSELVQGRLFP